jgi:hypothetical protein
MTMTGWKRGRSTSTYVECAGVGDGRLAKHARDAIDVDVDVREAGTSTVGGGVWQASVRGGRTTTTTTTTSPTSSASTMTTTTTTVPTPGGGWTDDAMDVDGSTASSPARRVLAHRREFGFGFGFSGGVARALAFGSPSRGAFPLDPSA